MKTEFTPIAMRCTKEQFKAIEPKLNEYGLKIDYLNDNDGMHPYIYLTNIYGNNSEIISLGFNSKSWNKKANIKQCYETWDEATFLKACGIEIDTYTVSKDFILEAHESACSTWKTKIENQFPELFPKVELVTGWFKQKQPYGYWLGYYENDEIKYVITDDGFETIEIKSVRDSRDCKEEEPATKEEVEKALIAEAKKRGFKEGFVNTIDGIFNYSIRTGEFYFDSEFNSLYVRQSLDTWSKIFDNGKWAEIISEPIELSLDEIAQWKGVDVSLIKIKK